MLRVEARFSTAKCLAFMENLRNHFPFPITYWREITTLRKQTKVSFFISPSSWYYFEFG